MKISSHSRGNGLVIWSVIFMALSVILPGVATIISIAISFGLHKYPERRNAEIILIVISVIITVILFMTGYITDSWSDFLAGFSASLKQ